MNDVPAHEQKVTHSYVLSYPAHEPRESDPHKPDFEEWKRRRREEGTYYCDFAHDHRGGDTSECDMENPLEAHHSKIEFAMVNEVDLALLEKDYPGISQQEIGAWLDSAPNLTLYCRNHHRGPMGVHSASYSDFTSEMYVRNLIKEEQ